MPLRLRLLLDTNILIPLHDSMIALQPSLTNFVRLCNVHGHQLLYHPASKDDIARDTNEDRRKRTLARLEQYSQLERERGCPWNEAGTSANDACDNEILYALYCNAAHALITEDQALHRKARARGLGDRVYFIQSADEWMRRLHDRDEVRFPNIEDVELHTLTEQLGDAFFDSLRHGYGGFDGWFRAKAMEGRRAWIYRNDDDGKLAAICIYAIQADEVITDDRQRLEGDSLKLCTFKVGESVKGGVRLVSCFFVPRFNTPPIIGVSPSLSMPTTTNTCI